MSYSAQDVIDLSEVADKIINKLDEVIDSRSTPPGYKGNLVRQACEAYASRACLKYEEVFPK